MKITYHFIVGLILSVILFPFFGIKSIIALIVSVLIDVDHFLWYILRYKKFDVNIKKIFNYYVNCCGKQVLCIFHTIEFLILLAVLSFFSEIFLIIFIAVLVHFFMDYMDWFIWFSIYSQRTPSILLWPLVYRRSKIYNKWFKKLGNKCIVCGFDKAFDIHMVFGDKTKAVLLCPNHHFMVHRGLISEKELLKLFEKRRKGKKKKKSK